MTSRRLRSVLKMLGLVFGTLFLLGVSCLGLIAYRARSAAAQIDEFCAGVSPGQSSVDVTERARASGLDVREEPNRAEEANVPEGTLLVSKGVLLARHQCEVSYSGGRVTRAARSFID